MTRKKRFLVLPPVLMLAACGAATPGAQPHDMSMSQHETAATTEDTGAAAHAAMYNADATVTSSHCGHTGAAAAKGDVDGGCWTSVANPTSAHLDEAERHRKMAADHRAASQSLKDAEAKSCMGISDRDRDMSPFEHREDIESVSPLNATNLSSKSGVNSHLVGATIVFRAVPGMTQQWLQRVVECHVARNSAVGHDVPEMPSCPLVPNNVTAKVVSTDAGFAIEVRSDDSATASEILRRAQSLALTPH